MSSISKNKKRKNKKKYFQSNKKHKSGVLEAGLKGFLITCNNEHQCVKEAYNLLNEFADDLYGPEFEADAKSSDSKELDIEEELNKESEAMKTKKRRFQQSSVEVQLQIGHTAIEKDKPSKEGYTHDWKVFVSGPNDCAIQHFIDKVVFHLRDSFTKPRRVIKEPPFQVQESSYTGFTMPIDVYFRTKGEPKKKSYIYDLYLRVGEKVNNIRLEKLTFRNPDPEFKEKLLLGGGVDAKSSDSKELDIEEELNKEIEAMKTNKRRFQQVCTMVKGILFINSTVPDPTNLASSIFDNVLQTGKKRGRFILKMVPIISTCKATQNDIRKHLDEYLEEFMKDDNNKKLSYRIESRIRHNNNISTSHVLWYVRESVEKFAPEWVVSLKEPQLVFSIQILRTICCIGILKNYMEYRKYNLSEAASINDKDDTSQNTPHEDSDEKQEFSDEYIVNEESNLQNSSDKLQVDDNKDDKNIEQNNVGENSTESKHQAMNIWFQEMKSAMNPVKKILE